MAPKIQYNTRHREALLEYLEQIPGQHFTAADLCRYFKEKGRKIGTATIYRHLERLVEEGAVNKYFIDENSGACYEYINSASCCHQPTCFHCKCEHCGKLIHLDCHEIQLLSQHLLNRHDFKLNPMRTVFYGLCQECQEDAKTKMSGEGQQGVQKPL